ncbi:MAG: GntR family transcriptional regulator [Thermodesulfobacteriota bacterium]|nr:GntR family transcriptional regulator [Thermodesulfobacteriota bacterium]
MPERQTSQSITSTLSRQIFAGRLQPGEKLPPLRSLAEMMQTDTASLRIALKQLEAMNVIDVKRSNGAYVKDYMKHAGLDFLSSLFMGEDKGREVVVDEYIVDEAWEFWVLLFPEVYRLALNKFTPRDIKRMLDIMDAQLESRADREKVMDLEIENQDVMVAIADNIIITLLFNMTRVLRKKMVRFFIINMEDGELEAYIGFKKEMTRKLMTAPQEKLARSPEWLREELHRQRLLLRSKMF